MHIETEIVVRSEGEVRMHTPVSEYHNITDTMVLLTELEMKYYHVWVM